MTDLNKLSEVHIPTVGGNMSMITIPIPLGRLKKSSAFNLTQVGVAAPSIVSVADDLGIDSMLLSYLGVGDYKATLVGAFVKANTQVQIGSTTGGDSVAKAVIIDDDNLSIQTEKVGALLDNLLTNTPLLITTYTTATPTTAEEMFNYILTLLDAKQLLIWNKIVVRYNGTRTEVDGKLYRSTGVYASSIKVINS